MSPYLSSSRDVLPKCECKAEQPIECMVLTVTVLPKRSCSSLTICRLKATKVTLSLLISLAHSTRVKVFPLPATASTTASPRPFTIHSKMADWYLLGTNNRVAFGIVIPVDKLRSFLFALLAASFVFQFSLS